MTDPSSLDKMNELVLGLLECPVCMNYMDPPIWQCNNGHSICSQCKPKVTNCPICNDANPQVRNITLEHLCETAIILCENSVAGCAQKTLYNVRLEHARVCPCRLYECPVPDCSWKGRRPEILVHAENEHKTLCSKKELLKLSVPEEIMSRGIRVYTDENGHEYEQYDEDYNHVRFVSAHGEIFYLFLMVDYCLKNLCVAVQYIGNEENANYYTYEVKFSKEDTPERMLSSHFMCKDTDSIHIILRPPKCALFVFKTLKTFVVENKLQINVEINKLY